MTPEISVLLPVYSGSAFLESAFESLFAQTFSDFEIVVCNDASTDDSAKIIEKMAARDPRVKVFSNPKNIGLFANYNRCLEHSQGRFIKPFAQDDTLAPDNLAKLSDVLKKNSQIALVTCARNVTNSVGETVQTKRPFDKSFSIKGSDVILYHLISLTNWMGEPSTAMFRKELVSTGFDTDLFHVGDADMWFSLLRKGDYYFVDEVLATFRRHDNNATNKNLAGLLFALDWIAIGKKYADILDEFGETQEHYLLRVAEDAALQLDHLVRNQGLTPAQAMDAALKGSLSAAGDDPEKIKRLMAAYVELNYVTLRALTNTILSLSDVSHRYQSDKEYLNKKIENISNSTSWKLTAPLRKLIGGQT